jgi:ribosomal protein S18 acetylase RimI-like enzyme
VLKIRDAKPGDAPDLAKLMKVLDHDVDAKGIRKRMAALAKQKLPQLVATLDKKVVGLAGIHAMIAVHRDRPVGRITILVVAEKARGRGIGRLLTEAAEKVLRKSGCGMVEVTSNDRLAAAHAFYRHMGYERTSIRFFKPL